VTYCTAENLPHSWSSFLTDVSCIDVSDRRLPSLFTAGSEFFNVMLCPEVLRIVSAQERLQISDEVCKSILLDFGTMR
jgi:hypothetical protein